MNVDQTYDPTIEDAYRKQLVVDNRMCFVEVIDTAGQGECLPLLSFSYISNRCRGVCDITRSVGAVSTLIFQNPTQSHKTLREGQGFILVYSIASRSTFERLEVFRQSMRRVKRGDPIFMLVGNKCDKTYEREVSREEGAALARQFGCEFLETSAKTAQNVERLFTNLVRNLRHTSVPDPLPAPLPTKVKERKKHSCVVL